jgi:hypothetical protein
LALIVEDIKGALYVEKNLEKGFEYRKITIEEGR